MGHMMLTIFLLVLPGEYVRNCSESEARAWQDSPDEGIQHQVALPSVPALAAHSHATVPSAGIAAQPSGQTSTAAQKRPQFQHPVASCVQQFTSPVVSAGAQQKQQASSGWPRSSTVNPALAPAGLGAGLSTSKQPQGRHSLQAKLPQPPPAAAGVEEVGSHGRESLGGTQGAITGLTHMALQKHNEAVPSNDVGTGSANDTQGLGMQVRSGISRELCYCTAAVPSPACALCM